MLRSAVIVTGLCAFVAAPSFANVAPTVTAMVIRQEIVVGTAPVRSEGSDKDAARNAPFKVAPNCANCKRKNS